MSESKLDSDKWNVKRKNSGNYKPWTVFDPTHWGDNNDQQWWFTTFEEAINFAQREALREKIRKLVNEAIDDPMMFEEILQMIREFITLLDSGQLSYLLGTIPMLPGFKWVDGGANG